MEEESDTKEKVKKVGFSDLSNELSKEKEMTESANEENVSHLKTQLGCPSKLVEALKKQTNMSESQIHVRYLMFRSQYPSGYVGQKVLRDICLEAQLNEEECDDYVGMVFRLFGVKKRGWGAKLIGFREVLLATEGISKMSKPDEILRWIFRVYDQHAVGEISVYKIESMMNSILCCCCYCCPPFPTFRPTRHANLCVRLKNKGNALDELKGEILRQFAMKPYDGDLISEEEFIYDGLNIEPLYQVLTNSLRNYNGESEDEDSENEETTEVEEEITKNISEKKEKK